MAPPQYLFSLFYSEMPTFVPKKDDTYTVTGTDQIIRVRTLIAIESTKPFVDKYSCTFTVGASADAEEGKGTFIVRQPPGSEPTFALVESGGIELALKPNVLAPMEQVPKTGGKRKTRHRRRKLARSKKN